MSSSPARTCMNGLCGATTTPQWKKGWAMKTGGFATLCYSCGVAYEKVNYCERFHLNEPGWRECKFCDTPIHCGCIVSQYLHEYLDLGGITCVKCLPAKETQPLKQSIVNDIPNGFTRFAGPWHPSIVNNTQTNNNTSFEKGKLTQLNETIERHQHACSSSSSHQFRLDKNPISSRECFTSSKDIGATVPYLSPLASIPVPQQSLGSFLGASSFSNRALEGRVEEKNPAFKQVQKSCIMFPKPLKSGISIRSQANKGMGSDNRVSRQPPDGLGRSQLLPRYWPKITDQELLQISGDLNSNCTITPLFEKVLSASDAGRIGRLVLPKACAEAYFPIINQSEGLPIKIRDIKGKEWTFQFRFWPNNNSRMYVLEGVTPCIQNMQLQAGDTVIFSRLDPEDQLIIGFRKAIISAEDKAETSALPDAVNGGTPIFVGNENMPTKNMEHENKKKMRNIGSKSKRLHMHSDDAMELKVTWQEAQEFLRPSLSSNPTVEIIEDCEFEEFDEPPVFGKKTIFTTTATGLQEQWVQCDSCSKRRKLGSDVLVPPKWTCSDNVLDPDRCSCSAPEERRVADLDRILRFGYEFKKRKLAKSRVREEPQQEATGLDALATVAVLGETVRTTTRHPRHRPGCSCIVCIQPPSGKGKHKPTCICNVCLTVKRRFKTLMQRRQKREAENTQKSLVPVIHGMESVNGIGVGIGFESSNKGQALDLNCDPKEEETMLSIEWRNVLTGLVPKGTSDVENDNKVVDLGI